MKRFITLLFCTAALAWSGCSDDKDDNIDAARLIGKWQQTTVYDGEYDEWSPEHDVLVLNADGTGYQALSFISTPERFTWRCEGSAFVKDFGDGDIAEYEVETLSDTELVLADSYEGEDGGHYTDKACYTRVQ